VRATSYKERGFEGRDKRNGQTRRVRYRSIQDIYLHELCAPDS
jgi:hypothetical protein